MLDERRADARPGGGAARRRRRRLGRRAGGRGAAGRAAMTARPTDGPLIWNVAGLLADAVGADRQYPVAGRPDRPARRPRPGRADRRGASGCPHQPRRSSPTRTSRPRSRASAAAASRTCRSRSPSGSARSTCRRSTSPAASRWPSTTSPTRCASPTTTRWTSSRRSVDAIVLAEPIAPLCRPDCPGLCIVCGQPLEAGDHDHPDDDIDPRLEALRGVPGRRRMTRRRRAAGSCGRLRRRRGAAPGPGTVERPRDTTDL